MRTALLASMIAAVSVTTSFLFSTGVETYADELTVVENGDAVNACFVGGEWQHGDGCLEAGGNDRWLLANRGLNKGDFHVKARLSIHGLDTSAARFAFNRGESSFGFEGNHGKIYITGVVAGGKGTARALTDPKEAGIVDGQPFTFEVVRQNEKLTFRINDKTVHSATAHDGPIPVFGFEPRRAVMRIEQFSVQGSLLADVYQDHFFGVWFHPGVTPIDTSWRGPFLNIPGGRILTVVNHEGGVQAFTSEDEGKTWEAVGRIIKEGQGLEIRDGNADTLLLRTTSGTIVLVFLNIFDQKWRGAWDYERQEPKDDMKRWTWAARSVDNGRSWQDVQVIQEGYAGALRDILQTSSGEIVVANQNVARNPGRHISYTYVSDDDGLTWTRSNPMDIGGKGDHAGSIEGTLTELRDGRLWILLRSYHGHFYECFSEDKGRTWTEPAPSGIQASGSPGILHRLASGRLVLLWNRFAENRPRKLGRREELSMAFSEDDGKTWTEPVIVVRERGKRQSYPKVFERRPGELWITTWQGGQRFKLQENDFIDH